MWLWKQQTYYTAIEPCFFVSAMILCFVQAIVIMAYQPGAGSSAASSAAVPKGSSGCGQPVMPLHRQTPPVGFGKGIDYHGAEAMNPQVVPHLSGLKDSSKPWLSNGEMIMVKWPAHVTMVQAFPALGAEDCLGDLRDELAVQGAHFTMRGSHKRKEGDQTTGNVLRIVGPPGAVVPIYSRLRKVVGKHMNSFTGLPPANRVRVFSISDAGVDYDKQKLSADTALKDVDDVIPAPDVNEQLSDDEYVVEGSKCPDYRMSMQLSMTSGPIDVVANDKEIASGRLNNTQDVMCSVAAEVLQPMNLLLMYLLGHARQYLAAAPDCCHDIPPRAWMTEQLDAAEARGPSMISLSRQAVHVVSISTNMGRTKQAIVAHLFNAVTSFAYLVHMKFVLACFGNDEEAVNLLRTIFAPMINLGVFIIASGGAAGIRMSKERDVRDMPLWMPHLPDHVVLPGQVPMPYQQHWHASLCKNAAHMVARHLYAAHAHLYINTDCDNFWPTVYLDNIVSIFLNSQHKKGLMIKPAGNVDGGLTGRMAYRPEDFWRIGGYDELLSPSGGQDVQLKSRLGLYAAKEGTGPANHSIKGYALCGGCFPNDFSNTRVRHDRGWSKVCNVDPAVLASFCLPQEKIWHKMNAVNWTKNIGPALTNGEWESNRQMQDGKAQLGCWWNIMPKCRVIKPDVIEDVPLVQWPSTSDSSSSSAAAAVATTSTAGIPEAVPGVPAVSAVTTPAEWLGPEPGGLPPCNIEAMVVNIYVVGVDRFSEHLRDDVTCPVNVLCVCVMNTERYSVLMAVQSSG